MEEKKEETPVSNPQEVKIPPGTKLPVGEEDLPERIAGLNKEMLPLLAKFELGLGAQAFLNPEGTISAQPVIMTARKPKVEVPVDAKSPVQNEIAPALVNPDK